MESKKYIEIFNITLSIYETLYKIKVVKNPWRLLEKILSSECMRLQFYLRSINDSCIFALI